VTNAVLEAIRTRRVARALTKLDGLCQMLKVLGSYPVWR